MELQLLKSYILEELNELQATEIKEIDVLGKTSITDLLIICSGRSTRHVKAIGAKILEKLKHIKQPALSISGLDTGEWALLDCGDIIVHIMTNEVRSFYNIEGIWAENDNNEEQETN